MNAYTIATLIHAFKRNRILNDNFLIIMEQQLFRACMELDGIDLSRILYTYAQHKVGSDTLYKVLIDRAYVKREKMGAFDFTIILTGLAKSNKGKPTDYAEFEDLLLSLS